MPPDTETRTQLGVTSREGQHHSPKLLESMRHALYVRHYSNRTTDIYCTWTRRFVRFHNLRHPKEMGETEINAFLTHLDKDLAEGWGRVLLPNGDGSGFFLRSTDGRTRKPAKKGDTTWMSHWFKRLLKARYFMHN